MQRSYSHIPAMLVFLLLFVSGPASSSEDQLRVVVSIKPVHAILSGLLKGVGGRSCSLVRARRHMAIP